MSTEEGKPSDEELARALRVFLSASDAFDEALGQVLGLNPTDVRCVDLLDQYGTITAGALAEVAGLSTGAVTFLLDRLERAGFVRRVRDVQDRRRVLVELAPTARARLSDLHAGLVEAWRASAQHFSVSEIQSIITFLQEGAKVYEAQVPVLCSQLVSAPRSRAADGRAVIKAAMKAQARAEALERLEQATLKLEKRAEELHHRAKRI
jgi:DNA-binding MarR family transcriptional regulator